MRNVAASTVGGIRYAGSALHVVPYGLDLLRIEAAIHPSLSNLVAKWARLYPSLM